MKIEDLPKEIYDSRISLSVIEEQIFEVAEEKAQMELPVKISVYDAVNESSKAAYSNETRRELEVALRLGADKKYQEIKTQLYNLLRQKDLLKINIEFKQNLLKVQLKLIGDEDGKM